MSHFVERIHGLGEREGWDIISSYSILLINNMELIHPLFNHVFLLRPVGYERRMCLRAVNATQCHAMPLVYTSSTL